MHVLIHDFTHWAGHPNMYVNKVFGILCNIPMGLPSAISFGKYHNDHHNYLGEPGKDPDLPTGIEAFICRNAFCKFMFLILLTFVYALRPVIIMPKKIGIDDAINIIIICCTNTLIYKFWGPGALLYTLLGSYLSIGPHPAAMHVIA